MPGPNTPTASPAHINRSAQDILGEHVLDGDPTDWRGTRDILHVDGQTPVEHEELPIVRALLGESTEDDQFLLRDEQRPDDMYVSVSATPRLPGTDT